MFKKILIANRGEIALRITRACREMDIHTVAVHSTADAEAMHVRLADESVCIGPPAARESYLNIPAILTAAAVTHADAIHPGIGFLSENAQFAEMVNDHGFAFIGPAPHIISQMGDKVTAKRTVSALGLPTIPGSEGGLESFEHAAAMALEIGYPVLLKAASGGGGKGMKVARSEGELDSAYRLARSEAKAAFGDDTVYMEKYLAQPRHIEVQVFGDDHGNAIHLGERDCSIQRSHQKLVEEGPSPALSTDQRWEIGNLAADTARKMGYAGAGTMEFLYEHGNFYFLEMNTRLQVEHPVTEMITGFDLVREQIRVAAGQRLSLNQENVRLQGHAIECRVNAEHPVTFAPSPGRVSQFHAPGGPGTRVDSALFDGYKIPPHYDSLIAKLIVHGATREECLMRLRRALGEFVIGGIDTSIPLLMKIVANSDFVHGNFDIHWLEQRMADGLL